uniref:Uncharacterized protein n=1 Tax=Trypanosoma vivax (strain Y486) TaxID=1055687 RepID=G0UB12_TRYVY|nr:hypothetical protein TVY486_1104830 [Trypanosoma vivax Y486]
MCKAAPLLANGTRCCFWSAHRTWPFRFNFKRVANICPLRFASLLGAAPVLWNDNFLSSSSGARRFSSPAPTAWSFPPICLKAPRASFDSQLAAARCCHRSCSHFPHHPFSFRAFAESWKRIREASFHLEGRKPHLPLGTWLLLTRGPVTRHEVLACPPKVKFTF